MTHSDSQNKNRNSSGCNCRKMELAPEEYRTIMDRHIRHIDESLRTPEAIYQKRLELCNTCPYQQNKMCRMCGCFVEIRASRKNMYCPLIPPAWERISDPDKENSP